MQSLGLNDAFIHLPIIPTSMVQLRVSLQGLPLWPPYLLGLICHIKEHLYNFQIKVSDVISISPQLSDYMSIKD